MTLDELQLIRDYVSPNEIWKHCLNEKCKICEKEKKILEIVDREIALKTFDPNKNA